MALVAGRGQRAEGGDCVEVERFGLGGGEVADLAHGPAGQEGFAGGQERAVLLDGVDLGQGVGGVVAVEAVVEGAQGGHPGGLGAVGVGVHLEGSSAGVGR